MFYGEYFDGVAEIVKADAVIADPETELRRFNILESLNVAFSCRQKACQSVEDAEGRGLVDRAEVGLGLAGPNDLLRHLLLVRAVRLKGRAAHALEVFGS
jgi:hypothetical protein